MQKANKKICGFKFKENPKRASLTLKNTHL